MAYSLKMRNEVVNQVRQGKSIREVSQIYGITSAAIRGWCKASNKTAKRRRSDYKMHDLEEIIEILRLIETSGLSVSQVADMKNLNRSTVGNWVRDKKRLLAVYSSQKQRLTGAGVTQCPGEEIADVSKLINKDTRKHIRDLKEENEFLKAKVAYLETLMEINGTPVSSFKKKRNIKPSARSSEEGSEM